MCGIAGILGQRENNLSKIKKVLEVQSHRGPDSTGIWEGDEVVIGHNRLSIIDLSDAANQPLVSDCGTFNLVFNGEIYNYIELRKELESTYNFRTQSDSEVILAAYSKWGIDCLNHFNGMFAFAIWDNHTRELFLARDRFGVKPLHYTVYQDQFYFASEIKAFWIVGIPKKVNESVLGQFLKHDSYGGSDTTFWQNILKVPGGHYLKISSKDVLDTRVAVQPKQWYNFVTNVKQLTPFTQNEAIEYLHELLKDSISLRFRSDVPVGINLSGGLDSSTLLGLVKNLFPENNALEAFSFYSDDDRYDELKWIMEMVKNSQVKLNACLLKVDEIPALIEKMAYYQDEPFGGFPTIAYGQIFKAAQEKGIKVLLDGNGMDEALAGYDYYNSDNNAIIQNTDKSMVKDDYLNADFEAFIHPPVYEQPFNNTIQNKQYRDIFYTKIPRSIRFNDRVSMMSSTELREPFLDYRLMEFGVSLPKELKIRNNQGKWILRELMRLKIGENVALAPKRPLQTPQREWMGNELRDYVNNIIDELKNNPFLDHNKVRSSWEHYLAGNIQSSFHIWKLISLYYLIK